MPPNQCAVPLGICARGVSKLCVPLAVGAILLHHIGCYSPTIGLTDMTLRRSTEENAASAQLAEQVTLNCDRSEVIRPVLPNTLRKFRTKWVVILCRPLTFYSLRGFFEHLDIERLEARIAQQFISSATMAAISSTPSRR